MVRYGIVSVNFACKLVQYMFSILGQRASCYSVTENYIRLIRASYACIFILNLG
jgi:hypothetical protein